MMKFRRRLTLCGTAILLTLVSGAQAQSAPERDRWGEKFNSPGATLSYKEIGRSSFQGKTVVAYNLFASGLPAEQHFVLWMLGLGGDPQPRTDAYLNGEGKVVNVLADPANHVAEDPINVKLLASKGEPFNFALISDDGKLQAFTQIIPFPLEKQSGPCHLAAVETGPYYLGIFIGVTGLQANEELEIDQSSENEGASTKAKADDQGKYNAGMFPLVKGKRQGTARFLVKAKSCSIGIEFPWGEGSQQYQ